MENSLSKKYSTFDLLKYTIPTILMSILTASYFIIDGIFVAQYLGDIELSAINIIVPYFNVTLAIALMMATGSSAIIGKYMGENNYHKANSFLTTIYLLAILIGLVMSVLIYFNASSITLLLKANKELFPSARIYLIGLSIFTIAYILQTLSSLLLLNAGKPNVALIISIIGGVSNIILDYLFINPNIFNLGIFGAALATGIGNLIPGIFSILYFLFNRKGILYFSKPSFNIKEILSSLYNGLSEFVGQLAIALTTFLINYLLLEYVGTIGITAYTIILYIQLFQNGIITGFISGVSPIISFKFGASNNLELRLLVKSSIKIISIISLTIVIMTYIFSDQAVMIFLDRSEEAYELSKLGLLLFSLSYLFSGFNTLFSGMFTALSNGRVSAMISFYRTFVFIIISLIILPMLFKVNGIFLAVTFAELLSLFVSMYYYNKYKNIYFKIL